MEYLPEARSDYIAAIFAEECGFIGIVGLIFLYMLIAYLWISYCSTLSDARRILYCSYSGIFDLLQAFLNLGVVSGLLPSKGTNLPFFSQGGSSLLANMMAVSILLNIARNEIKTRVRLTLNKQQK